MKRKNSDVKFIGKKIKMELNSGRQQHLSWEINWCQGNSYFLNYSKQEFEKKTRINKLYTKLVY